MEGDRLGSYTLEERVARGGMAEVWRAHDDDGAVVCIKRLDPSLRNDVDFIEMFRDEAALVLDLDHENVVRMKELIDTDDELAQVMEFVDGPSLARVRSAVGDEGLSVEEALQIGVYLSRALHHAHTRTRDGIEGGAPLSIVHRDVSPQNILVDKAGHLKLVDFGIAKAASRLTRTQAGTLKGKLSYMAPEQARGGPLDHRADQFATGILVWEMLTGRRLFGGRNELLILEQVQKSDPVPPSTVKKGIPRSVDKAVLRALRWHPEERFPDMAQLERALQACLTEVVPRGVYDLAPLVARALAASPLETTAQKAVQGAITTRVISAESESAPSSSDEGFGGNTESLSSPITTNPLAHPEHTGDFFKKRRSWKPGNVAIAGAGVVVIGAVVGVAVWYAERDPTQGKNSEPDALFADVDGAQKAWPKLTESLASTCKQPCVAPLVKTAPSSVRITQAALLDACAAACNVAGAGRFEPPATDALEQKLDKAPAHPCRTELLDDLLDKAPLSKLGRAALADDVDTCLAVAEDAPKLRASLKTGALDDVGWPKLKKGGKKHTAAVIGAHVTELEKRAQLALAVGEYERAKELLASALALAPDHVDDHALIAQAFRGLGDTAGAGYHLRLWLYANPGAPEGERAARYLKRYQLPAALQLSSSPGVEEKHARVARLLNDADGAADPVVPLENARLLAPDDGRVLLRLGDAYAGAGRKEDAKKTFQAALSSSSGAQARALKERIARLGS
jgi:serine/threonine protein kinase/tetratricopeptide (TPR) repeat protein